jgi:ribosomal protein L7/L12
VTTDPETLLRIGELERRVKHLYETLNVSDPPPVSTTLSPEVQQLVRQGKTIEAIKQYRAETGLGLTEAKAAIDEYVEA